MGNREEIVKSKIKMLQKVYLMSYREIGEAVGVETCVVCWWSSGKHTIRESHYNKICDILLKLSGYNIKYKGQALDILKGEE